MFSLVVQVILAPEQHKDGIDIALCSQLWCSIRLVVIITMHIMHILWLYQSSMGLVVARAVLVVLLVFAVAPEQLGAAGCPTFHDMTRYKRYYTMSCIIVLISWVPYIAICQISH